MYWTIVLGQIIYMFQLKAVVMNPATLAAGLEECQSFGQFVSLFWYESNISRTDCHEIWLQTLSIPSAVQEFPQNSWI